MESNLGSADLDPSLKQAYETAKDTKTILPILKEELKLTILSRRFNSGKGDINLNEKKPVIKRELSEEEIMKKLRRKEQNRRAAERCRIKKKKLNDQLAIDFINEQKRCSQLAAEVEHLRKEKETLQKILDEHAFTCARAVTPSPSYDDNTTFFNHGSFTCISNEMPNNFIRDTVTPYSDPFDEYIPMNPENPENDFNMYHPRLPSAIETKGAYSICTIPTEELPEIQLPDDLAEFSPVSPEMVLGRQSISDYLDNEILNN